MSIVFSHVCFYTHSFFFYAELAEKKKFRFFFYANLTEKKVHVFFYLVLYFDALPPPMPRYVMFSLVTFTLWLRSSSSARLTRSLV